MAVAPRARTDELWTQFQAGESLAGLPAQILESWQRCTARGLAQEGEDSNLPPGDRLSPERDALLCEAASSVARHRFSSLPAHVCVALTNPAGEILQILHGSHPLIDPGASFSEEVSGTNAAAIALRDSEPYLVRGREHYCQILRPFATAAAPIRFRGETRGLIFAIQAASEPQDCLLTLLECAACAIEARMRSAADEAAREALLESRSDGAMLVDAAGRILAVNQKAETLLNMRGEAAQTLHEALRDSDIAEDIINSQPEALGNRDIQLALQPGGVRCRLTASRHGVLTVISLRESPQAASSAASPDESGFTFNNIIGSSPALRETFRMAHVAAQSDMTALVLGESGTGKELFAQAMHNAGKRARGPFVVVNCGALPGELVQSELFGYDEGAFTGAARLGKPGKFELADSGTIFLDEIGEMPPQAQVALLRVLQSGEVTRVGGKTTRHVNVRVIAATNRNLREAIRQNIFREDLYYRLNVLTLHLPPLRERRIDIVPLASHFLRRYCLESGRDSLSLSDEVCQAFLRYAWPGNIRELENTVLRMACLADGDLIGPEYLPAELAQPQGALPSASGLLLRTEKECLFAAVRRNHGNLRAAAEELGVSRSGLYARLKKYGLTPDQLRAGVDENPANGLRLAK